jgi:hypothetical protein
MYPEDNVEELHVWYCSDNTIPKILDGDHTTALLQTLQDTTSLDEDTFNYGSVKYQLPRISRKASVCLLN